MEKIDLLLVLGISQGKSAVDCMGGVDRCRPLVCLMKMETIFEVPNHV